MALSLSSKAQYTPALASEIDPTDSANPGSFVEYDDMLYFVAFGTVGMPALWRYDPGTMQSEKAVDIAGVYSFTEYNGKLYWTTTGSSSSLVSYDVATGLVTSIGSGTTAFGDLTVYDDRLYFNGASVAGLELHYYDPATDSLAMVADLDMRPFPNGNSNPRWITEYDGKLFFNAVVGDANGVDIEPMVYESGAGDPSILVNLNPTSISNPESFTVLDDKLYFVANDGSGAALWVYEASTGLASAVTTPGADPRVTQGSSGIEMLAHNGRLYFVTRNQLWVYEPATGDAEVVTDLITQPRGLTEFDTRLFLVGGNQAGTSTGLLWYYDSATAEVDSVTFPAGFEYGLSDLFAYQGRLYFAGTPTASDDRELWSVGSVIVSVDEVPDTPRMELSLYPNPSDVQATIQVTTTAVADTRVAVYNLLGRRVVTAHSGQLGIGSHEIPLATDVLPSGIYLVRAQSGDDTVTSRLVVMR
jgi:hypothetical protein